MTKSIQRAAKEPEVWEIRDLPPFRVVAWSPYDAIMEWLAAKERFAERTGVRNVPLLFVHVRSLSHPERFMVATIVGALRARDRERRRCGLPPFWEKTAERLERERPGYIRDLARGMLRRRRRMS